MYFFWIRHWARPGGYECILCGKTEIERQGQATPTSDFRAKESLATQQFQASSAALFKSGILGVRNRRFFVSLYTSDPQGRRRSGQQSPLTSTPLPGSSLPVPLCGDRKRLFAVPTEPRRETRLVRNSVRSTWHDGKGSTRPGFFFSNKGKLAPLILWTWL
ncbi:hypothetical protein L218DRAFT_286149 [Marasmius fiardii PR-910]|nr:hypothetical protein L218DRAFT_286149 [Marasmius fiardii PR-910]